MQLKCDDWLHINHGKRITTVRPPFGRQLI